MTSRVLVCVPASDWCCCIESLQPITAILFQVCYVWWQSIVCYCTGTPRAQLDQVSLLCTTKTQAESRAPAPVTAPGHCSGCHTQDFGTWQVATQMSTSSVWAQSPPRSYLGAGHKYQVLTAALEVAFCLVLVQDHSALVRANETSAGWIIPEFSCSDPLDTPFQDKCCHVLSSRKETWKNSAVVFIIPSRLDKPSLCNLKIQQQLAKGNMQRHKPWINAPFKNYNSDRQGFSRDTNFCSQNSSPPTPFPVEFSAAKQFTLVTQPTTLRAFFLLKVIWRDG